MFVTVILKLAGTRLHWWKNLINNLKESLLEWWIRIRLLCLRNISSMLLSNLLSCLLGPLTGLSDASESLLAVLVIFGWTGYHPTENLLLGLRVLREIISCVVLAYHCLPQTLRIKILNFIKTTSAAVHQKVLWLLHSALILHAMFELFNLFIFDYFVIVQSRLGPINSRNVCYIFTILLLLLGEIKIQSCTWRSGSFMNWRFWNWRPFRRGSSLRHHLLSKFKSCLLQWQLKLFQKDLVTVATGLQIHSSAVCLCGLDNLLKMFTLTTFVVIRNWKETCSLEEVLFFTITKWLWCHFDLCSNYLQFRLKYLDGSLCVLKGLPVVLLLVVKGAII